MFFIKKIISIILMLLFIFSIAYIIYIYNSLSDRFNRLTKYDPPLSTQIFDKHNRLVANIFGLEHRIYANFDEIPIKMIEGIIAIEDTNFFEHNGINIDAIIRAIIKDIEKMAFVEGASTITQQLVKLTILSRDKKIIRKIKEILLSLKLEYSLSKTKILEYYLNEIYLGHNYYGVKTASLGYFRKELNELSLKEIAMIIGIPKSPNKLDPTKHYQRNLLRANKVLKRMRTLNWINEDNYKDAIAQEPIVYNDSLSKNKAPYVVDYVKNMLKKEVLDYDTKGYKVYLNIDLDVQDLARASLIYGYDKIKTKIVNNYNKENNISSDSNESNGSMNIAALNGSITVMENDTGNILALVGGVDYKTSSFNRAYQANRQIGSSAKPFIYQIALNRGYHVKSSLKDITRTYEYVHEDGNLTWKPRNYGKNIKGLVNFDYALMHSRNLATINLVEDIGLDYLFNKLKFFNFKKIPFDLSISLGSFGATSLQMQEYYSLFSNKGVMVKANVVSRIENKQGDVFKFEPEYQYKIDPAQAYLTTYILKKTISYGTGRRARVKGIDLAGKTGTTNKNLDVWFAGFSPSVQTIIWYGNDNSKSLGAKNTGGSSAAPVFSHFYKNLIKLQPHIKKRFDVPKGVLFDSKKIPYTQISKKMNQKQKINTDVVF